MMEKGYRPSKVVIENLMTPMQFDDYRLLRGKVGLTAPEVNSFDINFPHIMNQRMVQDGYSSKDILEQIKSATSKKSIVFIDSQNRVNLMNPNVRRDGYGNTVNDVMGFSRRNKPTIQTVFPMGDKRNDLPKKKGLLE